VASLNFDNLQMEVHRRRISQDRRATALTSKTDHTRVVFQVCRCGKTIRVPGASEMVSQNIRPGFGHDSPSDAGIA